MTGLRVRIRGSRRIYECVHDDGYWVIVVHWRDRVSKKVRRSNIVSREERGVGWVPTEIPA